MRLHHHGEQHTQDHARVVVAEHEAGLVDVELFDEEAELLLHRGDDASADLDLMAARQDRD